MRVIRSRRVVTPEGVRPAAIHVRGETIERVAAWDDAPSEVLDYEDLAILPGIVGGPELAPAMQILASLGSILLVHAEVAGPIDAAAASLQDADPRRYATYLASRPPAAEEQAIALVTRLCRTTRARTHIVHHSAASALPLLRDARAEGLPLSAETCPHYLHFTAEGIA